MNGNLIQKNNSKRMHPQGKSDKILTRIKGFLKMKNKNIRINSVCKPSFNRIVYVRRREGG